MKRRVNGVLEDIPEETIVQLASEIGIVPFSKLRVKYGVGSSTIQKIKAAYGRPSASRKIDVENLVREYFPEMSSREMAQRFGHSCTVYSRCAKALGIAHTEGFYRRIKSEVQEKFRRAKTDTNFYKNVSKSLKRKWKMEILRVMSGSKQETGYKVRTEPKHYSSARSYLVRKRGYIISESDNCLFFYSDKTIRSNESLYAKKYKFKFKRYETSSK
ncbi:MAG: hypothetical protein ACI4SO_07990 [Muribaculaceae bacterium]